MVCLCVCFGYNFSEFRSSGAPSSSSSSFTNNNRRIKIEDGDDGKSCGLPIHGAGASTSGGYDDQWMSDDDDDVQQLRELLQDGVSVYK